MPMIRAMRLLNAIELGTTTGAQLEALLSADPSRLGEMNVMFGIRGQVRRMLASGTTMAAILSSPTALGAMASNPVALALVAADPQILAAFAESPVAKMGIFNSDSALAYVATSIPIRAALSTTAQYVVRQGSAVAFTNITAPSAPVAAGSYIVLGVSTANAPSGQVLTLRTLRAGSKILGTTTSDGVASGAGGGYFPRAIPVVSPFQMGQGPTSSGYTWYFGMVRCDI